MKYKSKTNRKGTALIVVLFIIMVITISSLGFLSRSDVELACGENMTLRAQMDYLAESGLENARGLILNENDFLEDWTAYRQPLYNSNDFNDFYDVNVIYTGGCNYQITCNAYREKGSEKIGRSALEAELRLDPCIAFWSKTNTTFSGAVDITGDVYCDGTLTNNGIIDGDVFANLLGGSGSKTGRWKATGDLSLAWPRVTVDDFTSNYSVQQIDVNSLENIIIDNPAGVVYCPNDIELSGNVNIVGMLIVDANLTIVGNGNIITAGKNMPAVLLGRNLTVESGSQLTVNGLAVVNRRARVNGNASINGALYVGNGISGIGNTTVTAEPLKTAIITWSEIGDTERWGQVAGAFFKSIKRK